MQLLNVTARLLASSKGHRDLENLFQWKKANKTTTFKKAQKIWGTAGCSALVQTPGMLQNQPYMGGIPGTRNKYQVMRSNQSVPIHQGFVLLGPMALWQRGHCRCHSPRHQQGFHQPDPQQPCSLTEDTNYWMDAEPQVHQAQNSLWFKLNYQVVTTDTPQSPELGQNMLNILVNRRESSQGQWFVQPEEEKAQRRANYSFLLEQGL